MNAKNFIKYLLIIFSVCSIVASIWHLIKIISGFIETYEIYKNLSYSDPTYNFLIENAIFSISHAIIYLITSFFLFFVVTLKWTKPSLVKIIEKSAEKKANKKRIKLSKEIEQKQKELDKLSEIK